MNWTWEYVPDEETVAAGAPPAFYSDGGGGNCVEIAPSPALTHIRDSKTQGGPILRDSTESWAAFVQQVRAQ
ncbi:DUF397 domain-containing protein [Streptomyces sp. NPDC005820]|uniref:DUF397 domain-containing protein n=1 Tax=Streptomyces sp. NPDC005820 TaxID=3157069 RepID=UPI0033EEF7AF